MRRTEWALPELELEGREVCEFGFLLLYFVLGALREDCWVEQRRQREVLLSVFSADERALRFECCRTQFAALKRGDVLNIIVVALAASSRQGSSSART